MISFLELLLKLLDLFFSNIRYLSATTLIVIHILTKRARLNWNSCWLDYSRLILQKVCIIKTSPETTYTDKSWSWLWNWWNFKQQSWSSIHPDNFWVIIYISNFNMLHNRVNSSVYNINMVRTNDNFYKQNTTLAIYLTCSQCCQEEIEILAREEMIFQAIKAT